MVEPVDPLQGGVLDVVEALPGAAAADQFGLVQADDRLGQGVVERVADAADRRDRADLGQPLGPLGVANGQVVGGFNADTQRASSRGGRSLARDGPGHALGLAWMRRVLCSGGRVAGLTGRWGDLVPNVAWSPIVSPTTSDPRGPDMTRAIAVAVALLIAGSLAGCSKAG